MDVVLVHNPDAGAERLSEKQLRGAFEDAGHEIVYCSTRDDGWKKTLKEPADAIVAVGGDGTIRRVALALSSSGNTGVPLAIVPMGTANNLARAVGAGCSGLEVAAGLSTARSSRLAVGLVLVPGECENRFVESAGQGVFTRMLHKADDKGTETMEEGLKLLRRVVEKAEPRFVHIEADGTSLGGEYIMVELMNVPSIGPRLDLAPGADHTDDRLELVLVGAAEREALAEYLEAPERDQPARFPIPSRRVRRVRLDWDADWGHVDDQPWSPPDDGHPVHEVIVQIERHLPMLIP